MVQEDRDLTTIPQELDAKYLQLDPEGSLRPTILKPADTWTKTFKKTLLSAPEDAILGADVLKRSSNEAFDLLDALSRSGSLSIECAEMHVMIAATHRFARDVVDTVVMDNVNPIEKVERSVLIVATTVHATPDAASLLGPGHVLRVRGHSPALFVSDDNLLEETDC